MVHAIGRQFLTEETRIRSPVISSGISGRQSCSVTCPPPPTELFGFRLSVHQSFTVKFHLSAIYGQVSSVTNSTVKSKNPRSSPSTPIEFLYYYKCFNIDFFYVSMVLIYILHTYFDTTCNLHCNTIRTIFQSHILS
jgi:hypothetical protein